MKKLGTKTWSNVFSSLESPDDLMLPSRNFNRYNSARVVHIGVTCLICDFVNIVGRRFMCKVCDDFDCCEDCFNNISNFHPSNHSWKEIETPISTGEVDRFHMHCSCDNCDSMDLIGRKYECKQCGKDGEKFLLCKNCYETRSRKKGKSKIHWKDKLKYHTFICKVNPTPNNLFFLSNEIHVGVYCNRCDKQDIKGKRFQCVDCETNTSNYNLCEKCYNIRYEFHLKEHKFICHVIDSNNIKQGEMLTPQEPEDPLLKEQDQELSLPLVCFYQIFNFLNDREFFFKFICLSKRFRNYFNQLFITENILFKMKLPPEEIIDYCIKLEINDLSELKNNTFKFFPKLKELTLNDTKDYTKDKKYPMELNDEFAKNLSSLEKLILKGTFNISNEAIIFLKQLKYLDINYSNVPKNINNLTSGFLLNSKNLEVLKLESIKKKKFKNSDFKNLINLKKLVISDDDNVLNNEILKYLKNLEELSISFANGFKFKKNFQPIKKLSKLTIENCKFFTLKNEKKIRTELKKILDENNDFTFVPFNKNN